MKDGVQAEGDSGCSLQVPAREVDAGSVPGETKLESESFVLRPTAHHAASTFLAAEHCIKTH